MDEKLNKLNQIISEVMDIRHSIALLDWDEQVNMPPGGATEHGYMMGALGKIAHEKFVSDEVGMILEDLRKRLPELDPDSEDYRIISVTARDFDLTRHVPAEFISEKARVTSHAKQAWLEAKSNSNFSILRPHLEKIFELQKKYSSFFPSSVHPYDPLLEDFEPGLKTSDLQAIFNKLRPHQVELIKTIGKFPKIEDDFLHLGYDEKLMWGFSERIASAFGYDWNRGRQDPTAHPFSENIGPDDVRITSRWVPSEPLSLLFGTMHETGHALYDQGVGHVWNRTLIEGGASSALHESQSRLWENLVGRSHAFWEYFYPKLQDTFQSQLGNVNLEKFYQAINKVEPSFIRIEADEATYNLHIMLRLELEIALVDGSLEVRDLPEIWNEKMMEYLGVYPPNDALGVLQDIHWPSGLVGYFPTYAIGNLISTQLWEKFSVVNPDLEEQMRRGDFSSLLSWLRVKIHQYGRKYEPQELVKKVTQAEITPEPYLRYLRTKYGEIYGF